VKYVLKGGRRRGRRRRRRRRKRSWPSGIVLSFSWTGCINPRYSSAFSVSEASLDRGLSSM